MASGKKKLDLLKSAPARVDQPNDATSAEKMYLALKVQDPLAKPLPRNPVPAVPSPIPQFKFQAQI